MPLQIVPDSLKAFVQIEDVLVDSNLDRGEGQTNADFTIDLNFNQFSRVIGVEIPEYHIPINLMTQFQGANLIDFELTNPAINGGLPKIITAELPTQKTIYHTPEEFPGCTLTALYSSFQLAISKDPDFAGKVDIVPQVDPEERTRLLCRTLVFPPLATWPGLGSTTCRFLFGTGPNVETSAGPILGFDPVDVSFNPVTIDGNLFQGIVSPRPILVNRFTFVDISFDEVPEHKPVLRAYLSSNTLRTNRLSFLQQDISARTRILTQPIRDLRRLTCRIRLKDNTVPQVDLPVYFTVRIFYLNLTHNIPFYARDREQVI